MSSDDERKVTRELRLIYYNNYLLKVGAIGKRMHSKMFLEILKSSSLLR